MHLAMRNPYKSCTGLMRLLRVDCLLCKRATLAGAGHSALAQVSPFGRSEIPSGSRYMKRSYLLLLSFFLGGARKTHLHSVQASRACSFARFNCLALRRSAHDFLYHTGGGWLFSNGKGV